MMAIKIQKSRNRAEYINKLNLSIPKNGIVLVNFKQTLSN